MKSCFPQPWAGNRVVFCTVRTYRPLDLANLWPALSRSANQLEQLVGKQGDDAEHESSWWPRSWPSDTALGVVY